MSLYGAKKYDNKSLAKCNTKLAKSINILFAESKDIEFIKKARI